MGAARAAAASGVAKSDSIQRVCALKPSGLSTKSGWSDDSAVEGQHRGHAFDLKLAQRTAGTGQGLLACGAGDDELGHQRVERAGH